MSRQLVLDTETTGLDPKQGHRIIEIGCIEIINRRVTGQYYHQYINPEREIDIEAQRVHGLSSEFLADKPSFSTIVDEFLEYVGDAELIIHNAPFDIGFINHELRLLRRGLTKIHDRCQIIDTLALARSMHPGQRNSLDALCKRYEVDNSNRNLHGALVDANLLAFTYLAMTSGQENLFAEQMEAKVTDDNPSNKISLTTLNTSELKVQLANDDEINHHQAFLSKVLRK